jgi:hypothetical protein
MGFVNHEVTNPKGGQKKKLIEVLKDIILEKLQQGC